MLTARLMTRRYVHQLVKHKENELDISGIWQITGYVQIPVAVNMLVGILWEDKKL
jgi:putative glycosyltransferase